MRAERIVRGVMALATLGGVFAAACADFEPELDPAGGLPDVIVATPSFSRDIEPILTQRCALGGCHSVASRRGDLVLQPPYAYDSIVGVRAALHTSMLRVKPGDADSSWLVRMIEPDPLRRGGFSRMPLGGKPLTPNQIATIINWVENGAPRN